MVTFVVAVSWQSGLPARSCRGVSVWHAACRCAVAVI